MLRTKFRENRPAGSGEDFLVCVCFFYQIWAWWSSLSCDPDFAIKFSFALPIDAPHKIYFDWPSGFREEDR